MLPGTEVRKQITVLGLICQDFDYSDLLSCSLESGHPYEMV